MPKRPDGAGNPRAARKGWNAAIAKGATPDGLIVAARGYAAERAAKVAREGDEQANWTLTPERWFERGRWRVPTAEQAAASGKIFVSRDDPLWPELEARFRREVNRAACLPQSATG